MNTVTVVLHYFGLTCLVASLLLKVLPSPAEINWKPYDVFYGVIRRASLNTTQTSGGSNVDPTK